MSNPLDLAGPDFLRFYALVALVTLGLLYVARASGEGGPAPRIDTGDPYLVAVLRGGRREALKVATIALIDRGLLQADPSTRTVAAVPGRTQPRHPLEQALLRHFAQSHLATTVPAPTTSAASPSWGCSRIAPARCAGVGCSPRRWRCSWG